MTTVKLEKFRYTLKSLKLHYPNTHASFIKSHYYYAYGKRSIKDRLYTFLDCELFVIMPQTHTYKKSGKFAGYEILVSELDNEPYALDNKLYKSYNKVVDISLLHLLKRYEKHLNK